MVQAVDNGLNGAMIAYVLHGFDPGSCGVAILLSDRDLANKCAHPNIKLDQNSVIDNTIAWAKRVLPTFSLNDKEDICRWIAHDGLDGAALDVIMAVKLVTPRLFDDWYDIHGGRAIMQEQK